MAKELKLQPKQSQALQLNAILSYFERAERMQKRPAEIAEMYPVSSESTKLIDLTKVTDSKATDWAKQNLDMGSRFALAVNGKSDTAFMAIGRWLTTDPLMLEDYRMDHGDNHDFSFSNLHFAIRFSSVVCNNFAFHLNLVSTPHRLVTNGFANVDDAKLDANQLQSLAEEYKGTEIDVGEWKLHLATTQEENVLRRMIIDSNESED
ncbi:MAG: hypothetical protein ACLRX6_03040 [Limosilactobacillus pontis]|uniref:hypothetical protein n=1 Tax=Limosilactobacillus pontis TaxID=35787 RepID=UPI0039A045E2